MDFEERRKHAQEFAAAYPQGASTAPTATTSEAKTWTGGVDAENGVLVLSNEPSGRIRALTTALRPYRFVIVTTSAPTVRSGWLERLRDGLRGKDEPVLSAKPLSREKGVLLRELIELSSRSSTGGDFRRTLLRGMAFHSTALTSMNLEDSDLDCSMMLGAKYTSFRGTSLRFSRLDRVELRETDFDGAVLIGSSMFGAMLPRAEKFRPADLTVAWLEGARVDTADWLERIRDPNNQPVSGLTADGMPRWKTVKATFADSALPPYEISSSRAGTSPRDFSGECVRLRSE